MRTIWIILLLLLAGTTQATPGTDTTQANRFSEFCSTTLKSKIDSVVNEYKQKGTLGDYSLFIDYIGTPSPNIIVKAVNNFQPGIDTTNQKVAEFRQKLNELNNSSTNYKVVYVNIRAWNVVFTKTVFGDTSLTHINYTNFLKPGNSNFTGQYDNSKEAVRTEISNAFTLAPAANLIFFVDCEFRFWKTENPDALTTAAPLKTILSSNSYISFYPYHFNNSIAPVVKDEYERIYRICFEHLKERERQHPNMYSPNGYWLYYYYEGMKKGLEKYKVYDDILSIRDTDSLLAHFSFNFGSDAAMYKALSLQQIIHVIKVLAKEHFYDNAANVMFNCMMNCRDEWRKQMLDSIAFSRLYDNSYNLQKAIFRNINGDNLGKYFVVVTQIANTVFPNYTSEEQALIDTAFIRLKPGGYFGSTIMNDIDDASGKISLYNLSAGQFVRTHPFKKVLVTITDNYTYRDFTWQRGDYKNIPAIVAYGLFNSETNKRLWQYLNTAVDVGMLFIGGSEIKYLFKAGTYINAFKNAASAKTLISGIMAFKGGVDIVLSDVMVDVFRQSASGRAWLEKYNRYTMWVDMGYLASVATKALLKNLYKEIKSDSKKIVQVVNDEGHLVNRVYLTDEGGAVTFRDISETDMNACRRMTDDAERKIEQETGFIDDSHLVGDMYTYVYENVRQRLSNFLTGKPTFLSGAELERLTADIGNQSRKEFLAYLDQTTDFENSIQAWKELNKNAATNHLRNDVDALKGFVTTPGKLVPTSLISRITQQGANKLKAWTKGRIFNYKTSAGTAVSGTAAEAKLFEDIESAIGNKTVLETLEDGQGRLSIVLQSDGVTYDLISVQKNVDGSYNISKYNRAYNQGANMNIDVGVSQNRLVPDYTRTMANSPTTQYLYPQNLLPTGKSPVVRIKMAGKRRGTDGDFFRANREAGLLGNEAPNGYVWHHMDDFEIDDMGNAWCSMQLVKREAHTGVAGMAHSGSVAQWKNYYMEKSKAPLSKFYEQ